MYRSYLLQACIIAVFITYKICLEIPPIPSMDSLDLTKGKRVGPCIACKSLVKSFLAAVQETTRESFAGGDADWEREKLGNYENSELRFIEIQEMLCSDVKLGKDQCYNLAEEYESVLEEWFYNKRKNNVDLYESFCINILKVCCPKNTYGPKCVPCPGGIESPCGGHGKCVRGGTRREPASCSCDAGYTGELCEKCLKGYYEEIDSPTFSCKICDKACKDHCRGPGPKNCEVCSTGYHFFSNEGCVEKLEKKIVSNISDDKHAKTTSEPTNDEKELKLASNVDDSKVTTSPHSEL